MMTLFGRKKITDERLATIFVNSIIDIVEKGFDDVAGFINDSPEFEQSPNLGEEDFGKFLMVVICGNINIIPDHFENGHEREIIRLSIDKFAEAFGMSSLEFGGKVKEYKEFMTHVNFPSKNNLYAMSKAVFHKYRLHEYQNEYYRSVKAPNPIFLKNLDDIMRNFLWDWSAFSERYKLA